MDTYEKKYNEALERARKIHDEIVNNEVLGFPGQITDIFPELRESEDERIRKAVIELLKEVEEDETYTGRQHIPDMLSYLERQKEQKPVECITDAEMEKGLDELTKFKQFASALSDMYNIIPSHSSLRPKDIDWNNFCAGLLTYLKKNQPVEWSEEDEKMRDSILAELANHICYNNPLDGMSSGTGWTSYKYQQEMDWLTNRLKSLRPSWKPSEEQMNCLCAAVDAAIRKHNESVSGYEPARVLKSLYEQLQKLM